METLKWIDSVIKSGNLCEEYTRKVDGARSKKQLADIALDYNGAPFLCEMAQKNNRLPYETIKKEFASFINGRYKSKCLTKSGSTYTVGLWCEYEEYEIVVDTTIATLLGCHADVVIPKNHYCTIFADSNCKLRVFCMDGAVCHVYYWGDAQIENPKQNYKIKINKRDE